jgi:hypothetical protein
MRRWRLPATHQVPLWLALVAAGCGGDGETNGDEEDAEVATASDAESASEDAEASDSMDGQALPDDDAGVRSDTGTPRDAGTGIGDDRLQPFEVGRRWKYSRVTLDGGGDASCSGSLESSVVRTVMRDAAVGYEYLPTCLGTTSVQMFLEGDDIWAYVGSSNTPMQYAKSPVQAGVTWTSQGIDYAWEEQGEIEVPAGRFTRCVRRVIPKAQNSYQVFCRGVGLVMSESIPDNTHMELLSKNF